MNNDLEEFLRRTASMRQQKAFEQRAEVDRQREQQSRARPQPYSNARRERQVDASYTESDEDEELSGGLEIIDEGPPQDKSRLSQKTNRSSQNVASSSAASSSTEPSGKSSSSTASQLRAMLANPDGVRQAFLLREILNRPRF